jgi:hypothetical protein
VKELLLVGVSSIPTRSKLKHKGKDNTKRRACTFKAIVSQVLLDFVNALACFALSNIKSNLTTCFSSMGITKKCHQDLRKMD